MRIPGIVIPELFRKPRPLKNLTQRIADKGQLLHLQLLLCLTHIHLPFRPGDYPGIGADGGRRNSRSQYQPLQPSKPAERHIDLPRRKRSACVDHRFFEGEALALVDSDRPGETDGILPETSQLLLLDLILFPVVRISDILPGLFFPGSTRQPRREMPVSARSSAIFLTTPNFPVVIPSCFTFVVLDQHHLRALL